jgi:hypothetical protein
VFCRPARLGCSRRTPPTAFSKSHKSLVVQIRFRWKDRHLIEVWMPRMEEVVQFIRRHSTRNREHDRGRASYPRIAEYRESRRRRGLLPLGRKIRTRDRLHTSIWKRAPDNGVSSPWSLEVHQHFEGGKRPALSRIHHPCAYGVPPTSARRAASPSKADATHFVLTRR